MKILTLLVFYILSIFMAGCELSNPAIQTQIEPTQSSVVNGTHKRLNQETTLLLVSPSSPTIRPSLTPTATYAPLKTQTPTLTGMSNEVVPSYVQQCINISESLPDGFQMEGKIIRYCEGGVCILSAKDQYKQDVWWGEVKLDFLFSRAAFSPDRQMLAYEQVTIKKNGEFAERYLHVVDSTGEEVAPRWLLVDWRLAGWLDNERLNLERLAGEQHFVSIYDPETHITTETRLPPLKDPYPGDILVDGANENYDPTYNRVTYLYEDYSRNGLYFALWDVWAGELLWQRIADNEGLFGTAWSPDGQFFAVASEVDNYKAELFVVSRDGQERQLTNLRAVFPEMNINIGYFDWSPNRNYISLWLNIRPGEYYDDWSFAILNLETGELIDTCITSNANQYPYSIWSPDSKQIAIQNYESENLAEHNLLVVDLQRNDAIWLSCGGFLLGWME